ncbi:MAG: hypothetical protein AAFY60_02435 [Myxococcota bacterium]
MDPEATRAVLANIRVTEAVFKNGSAPALLGTVSGSEAAQRFWLNQLERMQPEFGATALASLHEDLPVNQAFGLLLMWQRIREQYEAGRGALLAFVFGEGSRATPLTECEGGQKPAMRSFVMRGVPPQRRAQSIVELALRYFAPVEHYLRKSGFNGVVVKWGDEIQIPTLPLDGSDPRFASADIVRFVSISRMNEDLAANKDWVGVDESGNVTAFIPRRPLAQMAALAERGVLQERDDGLYGGINLGSIAVSDRFLDALLAEFSAEVNDPNADRKARPDLDPQLFTALTLATIDDVTERQAAWEQALSESTAMAKLAESMPDLFARLRAVVEGFKERHGHGVRIVAMDFGDQYWGDIGQHRAMFELYTSLLSRDEEGEIARALAGLEEQVDANGNRLAGNTFIGSGAVVRNSVLIDAKIHSGEVHNSVLIGTHCGELHANNAFDVQSTVSTLSLKPRSGSYRVVDRGRCEVAAGERLTTVVLPDEFHHLRVHEDDPLRDRERCYDVAIRGNPIAFAKAHEYALGADLSACEQAREKLESQARETIDGAFAPEPT